MVIPGQSAKPNLMPAEYTTPIVCYHTDLIVVRKGDDGGTHSKDHTGMDFTVSVGGAII